MHKLSLLFRHTLIVSVAALLSACGQPGPLYLPGTKPPFYVPPETNEETRKTEPPELKNTGKTGQPEPAEAKPESTQKPEQKQESLDQPPNQP
jgi:predicted small lipoprotein YifL